MNRLILELNTVAIVAQKSPRIAVNSSLACRTQTKLTATTTCEQQNANDTNATNFWKSSAVAAAAKTVWRRFDRSLTKVNVARVKTKAAMMEKEMMVIQEKAMKDLGRETVSDQIWHKVAKIF